MVRFPTQDLVQRLAQNGGRIPYGLFRPNQWNAKPRRGYGPEDPIDRLVKELRAMLRDLTNINVRQPSHMAPPFRSEPWIYQATTTGVTEEQVIRINSNSNVPVGSNGVLTHVSYVLSAEFNAGLLVPAWGETGASTLPLTVRKNGLSIPALNALLPAYDHGAQVNTGLDYVTQNAAIPQIPIPPIPLNQGDFLTWFVPSLGTGRAWLQFAGYTYPIEVDGDGVRGTLADRG